MELLRIEYRRDADHPLLATQLDSENSRLVEATLKTGIRIGAVMPMPPKVVGKWKQLLGHPDPKVRAGAARALGDYRFESSSDRGETRARITQMITTERDPEALGWMLISLGSIANPDDMPLLARFALDRVHPVRNGARIGLYAVAWKAIENDTDIRIDDTLTAGLLAATNDSDPREAEIAAQVVYAFANADRELRNRAVSQMITDSAAVATLDRVRSWLYLSSVPKTPEDLQKLLRAENDPSPSVRSSFAAFVAPYVPDPNAGAEATLRLLGDPVPSVVYAASTGLRRLSRNEKARVKLQEKWSLVHSKYQSTISASVRTELLETLVAVDPVRARPWVIDSLKSREIPVRARSVALLSKWPSTPSSPQIIAESLHDPAALVRDAAWTTAITWAKDASFLRKPGNTRATLSSSDNEIPDQIWKAIRKAVLRTDPEALVRIHALADQPRYTFLLPELISAYWRTQTDTRIQLRTGVIQAIGATKNKRALPVLIHASRSSHPSVVRAAADAYRVVTGKDLKVDIPLTVPTDEPLPTWDEIRRALASEYYLITTRGTLVYQPNLEAPLAVTTFARLSRQGQYREKQIDYVWPSYIIGGGGDEYGARNEVPLARFRAEIGTPFDHARGALCFAGDGSPDSFDGRFVIDLNERFYDARIINTQTAFGRLTQGDEILDQFELFDRILDVKAIAPRSSR